MSTGFRNRVAAGVLLACVSSGPAFALDSFRIEAPGATAAVAKSLEQASLLAAASREGVQAPTELMAAARAEYARLVGALYGEGYYGGTVRVLVDGREAATIDPLSPPDRISRIIVQVQTGPQYRFGQATVAPLASGTEMPEGFRTGAPAPSGLIQEAVDAGITGWRMDGHAKAEVSGQRIVADHAADRLDAEITLEPGPKLTFGRLLLDGESAVSPRRIVKIAGLPTGAVYSPIDIERSARRLRDTGVFRSVSLTEAEVPNPDGSLDITAAIVDQKPRRFGFGAELATDEGLTLSAFWMHRNLRGGAERLRIDGEISGIGGDTGGIDYSLGVELGRPATIDAKTDAVLTFDLAHEDEPDFTSDSLSLGLGFIREVRDELTARASIEYRFSDVEDSTGKVQYRHLAFPLGWTLDRREGLLNTNDGYYADFEIAPFIGLSGSESGTRITFDARAYEDFGPDNRYVLAAHLQVGSIVGASLTGLPNDLRFYSGGGGTVRGHEYQSLDVDLGGGARSGGRSLVGLQTELRGRVTDAISVVGFVDWGYVSAGSTPGKDGAGHTGAGLGLRYDTGIGPLRVDVGVPVTGPKGNSNFHIYIGIGQAF